MIADLAVVEVPVGEVVFLNLTLHDLPEILDIERASFIDPWPAPWFRAAISSQDVCWGAFKSGRLVGYLIAVIEEPMMHLANLAVEAEFRRCGVGRRLCERLIELTIQMRLCAVVLETRRSNAPAIELYESLGFRQTGVEVGYYQGSEDALILTREIASGVV